MYQVKDDQIGEWVHCGYEGTPLRIVAETAIEHNKVAKEAWNEALMHSYKQKIKEAGNKYQYVINECFRRDQMRWRVDYGEVSGNQYQVNEEDLPALGRYYDIAWETGGSIKVEEEEDIEWQIRVGGKSVGGVYMGGTWQDARFLNPYKIDDETTVIGYLIANGIKRDWVSIYPTRLRETEVRDGGKAAGYFMNPEETREAVEKGMRKGLVRRKIAESPEDVLKQLKLGATYHDLLRRSVKFALITAKNTSSMPYLEINEEQIKFAGKTYDRKTLADLLIGTTREIPWHETKYHEGPITLEQRIVVDFKKMIEAPYGPTEDPNKVLRNMKFMTIKELQSVKEDIGTLSSYLVGGAVKRGVREIPIAGTVYSLAEADDAFEIVDTIAQAATEEVMERTIGKTIPALKWLYLGLKLGFDVWGLINAFRYLSALNKALDEELLTNRKDAGEDEAMQFFRMAAGREVELATMAWRAYKELTESRVANVTIGLDQSVRNDLQEYYDEYFERAGNEPYWAVMKVNQILRIDLEKEPLKHFPTEEADIPSYLGKEYDLKQDVFMNLLPGVVETAEYLYHEEFVPGEGIPGVPGAPLPHPAPGIERYRGPKLFPWEGSEQTYLAPSDGTQSAFASLATTGGRVGTSRAAGASSLSLPSFPSVGFPGLGAGPSALPSLVGFGGGGGGVPSTPSGGLPSVGWGGAAVPASSIVPAGGDGVMASGGYFLGGLKQLVAGQGKARRGFSPALDLGAFLLAPFKNLIPSRRPSAPGERGGKLAERLFQIPQMLLTSGSPAGPLFAAGGTAGNLLGGLSEPQPQPQVVYRFEQGSVQIYTQKISPERLGNVFIDFLRQYSQTQ